jgi:hypothetical protein
LNAVELAPWFAASSMIATGSQPFLKLFESFVTESLFKSQSIKEAAPISSAYL